MKQAWTRKVKAYPMCTDGNESTEGELKQRKLHTKRRIHTSVAVVSFALSMGMPSLLLNRQSDRTPAAAGTKTGSGEHRARSGEIQAAPQGGGILLRGLDTFGSKDSNSITPASCSPLPAPCTGATQHHVKAGDTLTSVAQHYGVSLQAVVEANRLTNPDLIRINQQLKIPGVQNISTASIAVAATRIPSVTKTTAPRVAATTLKIASAKSNLPVVLPVIDNNKVTFVKLTKGSEVQADTSAATGSYGVGGTISDEAETQLERSESQYVKKLQAEIQQLRQRYSSEANSTTVSTRDKTGALKSPLRGKTTTALEFLRERRVNPQLGPVAPNPSSITSKGYIWPAKGAITSGYGWRWGRMHKGIDIGAPVGTPIMAAAPGIVVKAGWTAGGYGNLVDIVHADGSVTRYAHNKKVLVRKGQEVRQGQQISLMGSTGFSTGPHLHFEIHPSGKKAVNPMAFLPPRDS